MGATVIRTSGSEGAIFCGSAIMCEWIFPGVSPPGATSAEGGRGGSPPGALSAPKGEWPYTEAPTMWSCPD